MSSNIFSNTPSGLVFAASGSVISSNAIVSNQSMIISNGVLFKLSDTSITTDKLYLDGGGDTYIFESSGTGYRRAPSPMMNAYIERINTMPVD